MPSDLELQAGQANRMRSLTGYDQALERYYAARKARAEAEERRRLAEAQARQETALQNQQLAAQSQRQQQEQAYTMQNTAQRANINADAANMDHVYTTQRDQLQQKGIQKRDQLQAGYDKEAERRKALDQQIRDQRMFGFQTQENDQQFGHQIRRDELQHGNTMRRDQQQQYNTLERDASQFGYSTLENRQQQRNTLERDAMQHGNQLQRDELQNDYAMQRDELQYGSQFERDKMQQQFEQQNMYQRETADIAANWNEQVQQARNAGMDFSPRQQQEMKELDAAFRKNVMNSDLDQGLKQQAMLLHQKKLAAIIPEEKVRNPQESFEQSIVRDPETGEKFMVIRDPKGFDRYEPIGTGQPDQAKQIAEQQKKASEQRKMILDREKDFQKLHREIKDEQDPDTLEKIYKTPEEVDEEALRRFAADERYYTDSGLPPHEMYQLKAKKDEQKKNRELENWKKQPHKFVGPQTPGATPQATENPYRQKLEQASQPKPIVFSYNTPVSPEIRQQLKSRTGSDELYTIREKHKSNSVGDQAIRLASEVVMKAILTNDISDPDLAESIDMLRKRAGLKME